jgi:hypothetical protein
MYNTTLSTVLYIRDQELIHLITESLYLCPTSPRPFSPQPLVTTVLLSASVDSTFELFFFAGTGNRTQGLEHARQAR